LTITLFFVLTLILVLLGCPIVPAFLTGSFVYFFMNDLSIFHAMKIMFNGTLSFTLLAVPFFILAAQIMNHGKITFRMFDFANKLVGHFPGGLSHVNILTSIIFSGMSGSAMADTSGVGAMSARAMMEKGFSRPFSAAVTISSAIIGPIIPPSIPIVIYAWVADVSVASLFLAAIVPGLTMGLSLFIYCWAIAIKRNYPREDRAGFSEIFFALRKSFLALITPVILIGGIYSGIFTPTESAAVASLYAIVLTLVYERSLSPSRLFRIGIEVTKLSANILIIAATVSLFSWIVAVEEIPQLFTQFINRMELTPPAFLLAVNVMLLVSGCILPTQVMLFVFIPIMMPAVLSFGIDPVHFGIVAIVNLMIGLNTPPFGLQLFVASGVLKVSVRDILKESWPMLICLMVVLLLITYVEPLVMFLPRFLSY